MKYLLSLKDPKSNDFIYLYVFAPAEEGTLIKYGHDDCAPDGLREWKVIVCSACQYGL